jgi:ketosteroid isomerase-like protein
MKFTSVISRSLFSLAALSALSCASAQAAEKAHIQPLDKAIQARYDAITKMLESGTPSADIGRALYWPDVIVTGQGAEKVYRGLDALQPTLAAVLKDLGPHCKFSVRDPAAQSGSVAAVYSQLGCKSATAGQPDINLRLLYVWEKRGNEWKVVREMYSEGTIN